MNKIVVAGSINMDVVAQTERHPRLGETVIGTDLKFIPGGKGANQAVAASRLGGNVSFIGKVGNDAFGETLLAFLKKESLDLKGVTLSSEAPTGTALIVVDQHSENAIVVVPGSNGELSIKDLDVVQLSRTDFVVSQFEISQNVIYELFKRARAVGGSTILNPAPAASFTKDLLALVDYLIVNETELAFFMGSKVPPQDIRSIAALAAGLRSSEDQVLVVTLGSRGAICIWGDRVVETKGYKVNAVDTTGAGDCFVGAFAVARSEGKEVTDALEFANAASSISVQRLGASTSLPLRAQVEKVL